MGLSRLIRRQVNRLMTNHLMKNSHKQSRRNPDGITGTNSGQGTWRRRIDGRSDSARRGLLAHPRERGVRDRSQRGDRGDAHCHNQGQHHRVLDSRRAVFSLEEKPISPDKHKHDFAPGRTRRCTSKPVAVGTGETTEWLPGKSPVGRQRKSTATTGGDLGADARE